MPRKLNDLIWFENRDYLISNIYNESGSRQKISDNLKNLDDITNAHLSLAGQDPRLIRLAFTSPVCRFHAPRRQLCCFHQFHAFNAYNSKGHNSRLKDSALIAQTPSNKQIRHLASHDNEENYANFRCRSKWMGLYPIPRLNNIYQRNNTKSASGCYVQ